MCYSKITTNTIRARNNIIIKVVTLKNFNLCTTKTEHWSANC